MPEISLQQTLLDTGLPLAPFLSEIRKGLFEKGSAVVRADTGSGKSTLLPLSLLEGIETITPNGNMDVAVRRNKRNRIIVLEPRRAAALGIAARMAELLGEKTGGRIGYAVRLDRKISSRTVVEVLTVGLFVRRLQADPSLAGIEAVVFDEFHERSVMSDLALAFLLDLRRMGSKIKILVMSATIDSGKIADFINLTESRTGAAKVPVFDIPGRVFPVETSYRPLAGKTSLGIETGLALTGILRGDEAMAGDILVFLPGRREIAEAEKTLLSWEGSVDFEILPLHGSLPLSRQRTVTSPNRQNPAGRRKRRVILSTNIAESALTIPGVTMVVDSGYVRLERFHIPTAMNRLSPEEASWASAEQRTGRAGRLAPGRCIRLWNPNAPRPRTSDPEIRRIDLAGLVLECLLWGIRSPDDLSWPESPSVSAWERAAGLLVELGAIDKELNPSALGREAAKLGLEPRLGILCLAGRKAGCPFLACTAAAILAEGGDTLRDGDFRSRMALVRNGQGGAKTQDSVWVKNIRAVRNDLVRRLELPLSSEEDNNVWSAEEEASIGELLTAAFPDRIAARQENGCFRFCSGREARVEGHLNNSAWLVAAEVDAGERSAFIRLAAPLSEETAVRMLEKQTVSQIRVEWNGLVPKTFVSRRAGKLLLSEERRPCSAKEAADDMPRLLQEKGIGILPWKEGKAEARRLLERIRFYLSHSPAASTGTENAWTDEALIQDAGKWLIPFINDETKEKDGSVVSSSSLKNALINRFGWERFQVLDRELPESFCLPRGRQKTIDYSSGAPVIFTRLEYCFGMSVHPRIMGVPVIFHLLSPADRPVQITSDIPGFWSGSYTDVHKDMKGRYPKHFWPEDPKNRVVR